ncbi:MULTISPECIES: NlpC/P60 family protein [Marinovum]|uniref:NlpC/P60 family protein n=1 Tax=Marinovum TaxID=367771 RepID=UPI00065B25A2|nr:NlpC/P60 family protein [Marinovum sp. PR37]AKO97603.1 putative tail assembly protein [Marinovum algicola DG 898]MDD9744263.1 NlpC/P60 family protein [Marinovum sp. PR37]
MSWSDRYVGLPAAKLGRGWQGVDCWGLVELVYREELGIELPSYAGTYADPSEVAEVSRLINAAEARGPWVPSHVIRTFDVLTFGAGRWRSHVGIALDARLMLHVQGHDCAKLEHYRTGRWQHRFRGGFRYVEGAVQ